MARGSRVVVVSDLHLAPIASEVSTNAADELAQVLGNFHLPGLLVIAGDGFEMLAAAPDVAGILDAHPQFTDAVKGFAADKNHRVVVTPGNHDGQLAWDEESAAVLRERLGVTDMALACDLAIDDRLRHPAGPGHARPPVRPVQRVRRSPVPGRHPAGPPRRPPGAAQAGRPATSPASLLEGVRWTNGDPASFLGSRLLYRMVAGWLWWLAVPFAAALLLRFMSFAPGVKPLLHHHAERWLVVVRHPGRGHRGHRRVHRASPPCCGSTGPWPTPRSASAATRRRTTRSSGPRRPG